MADETTQLLDRIKHEGYTPRRSGDGHYEVIDREGEVVRVPDGRPFRFSFSPRSGSSVKSAERELRQLGVLPSKNGDGKKMRRSDLTKQSDKLRGEVNRLLDSGLKQSDIYHFADKWAEQHGIGVPVSGAGVVSKLLKGHSLSNVSYPWLSSALSAIRRNNGTIPSMEHPGVRQPQPEPEVEEVGVEVEGESKVKIVKIPQLALDTLQAIYKEEKDHEAIMALIEQIAKLELQ